jgi:hypothetical protein
MGFAQGFKQLSHVPYTRSELLDDVMKRDFEKT